jgi:hypothetical protein
LQDMLEHETADKPYCKANVALERAQSNVRFTILCARPNDCECEIAKHGWKMILGQDCDL